MSTRGTSPQSVLNFFREQDLELSQVVLEASQRIVSKRSAEVPKQAKSSKTKAANASGTTTTGTGTGNGSAAATEERSGEGA